MKTVVGLGDAAIVDLLAEIGSFAHYWNSRQLIKLADLTLKDHSSGQHKGQKQVSKRGTKTAVLHTVLGDDSLVHHNEAFRALHEYDTTRAVIPLSKR
ncbi:transposase [Geobacillus zalihae]|uniref:transposase n=1 Tax=Geobacillus zalihae TaxID=213419 RepID=UPI000763C9DC